ncbi:hypothetical protein EOC94_20565 [Mesorhizobium sp. M6A.T.Ce.TU.016.01.1.1]|nr:hypothetical protein EOC94_20565 [Mesorhizobium sp. M6A.T.Ce.TU.016.01.1.1]
MAKPKRYPISPLAGEMSGRTEGGVKDRQLSTSALPTRISLRARLRSIDRSEGSTPSACRHLPRKGGDRQLRRRRQAR